MLAQVKVKQQYPEVAETMHTLVLMPRAKSLPKDLLHRELLATVLKRRGLRQEEFFGQGAIAADTAEGASLVWAMLDVARSIQDLRAQLKVAVQCILKEQPTHVSLIVYGGDYEKALFAELALYFLQVLGSGCCTPSLHIRVLKRITLIGLEAEICASAVTDLAASALTVYYLANLKAEALPVALVGCVQNLLAMPAVRLRRNGESLIVCFDHGQALMHVRLEAETLRRSIAVVALLLSVVQQNLPLSIECVLPIVTDCTEIEAGDDVGFESAELSIFLREHGDAYDPVVSCQHMAMRRLAYDIVEQSGVAAMLSCIVERSCQADIMIDLGGNAFQDTMAEEFVLLKYLLMGLLANGR